MNNNKYPEKPTDEAKIDSTLYEAKLIGKNKLGSAHIHGGFGNPNSKIKIAYLIGMHPLESKSHRALFESITRKDKQLNYSYYIYNINVNNMDEKTEGRMDGQLIAQEFVAPHVIKNNYDFVVDIHSNKGLNGPGKYEKTNFVFAPNFDKKSEYYQEIILKKIEELVYYAPEYRTSPEYITIPIAKSGIPTIVYETYSYESMDTSCKLADKLVECIDNIKFE